MKKELRTMVLSVDPAFPPISGGDLRNAAHANAASRLGPVLAASLYEGIESVSPVPTAAIGHRPRSAYSIGGSRAVIDLNQAELAKFASLLKDFRPHLVLVEGVSLYPLLAPIRACPARIVLDMHNVESELARMMAAAESWARPFRRGKAFMKSRALALVESEVVHLADAVWVCSEADRERLARITGFGGAKIVSNATPPGVTFNDRPRSREAGPRIVFIGHLGYRPNVLAARELVEKVLPLLRRRCPNATVTLAGRSPSRHVLKLAGPFVGVLSDPPDMAQLLAQSDFTVIPLRQGGGTRIKILEAMTSGVAVVATSVAAEGLDLVAGRHFALAETPEDMARAVERLVGNPAALAAMVSCGRDFVAGRYAPDTVAGRIAAEIEAAMSVGTKEAPPG